MRKLLIILLCLTFMGCQPKTEIEEVVEEEIIEEVEEIEEDTIKNYTNEEWYDRYDIYFMNRLPARASFNPYESKEKAYECEKSALDDVEYTQSERIISLNGEWNFYYANINKRLLKESGIDIWSRYEDWDKGLNDVINVPSTVQTIRNEDGSFKYEAPHYTNLNYPWLNNENIQYNAYGQPVAPTLVNGVMHYKRLIEVTPEMLDNHLILSFEGVAGAFYVYVNGAIVGYSEDSTTCAEFDITDYVCEGYNSIAVEVMQYSTASYFENQDMIRTYGIYRDVNLLVRPDCYIKDIDTTQVFDNDQIMLNTVVETHSDADVLIELYDDETKIGEGNSIDCSNCELWSDESPKLYQLYVSVLENGIVKECTMIRVGFRNITWDSENIYLNGYPILLKGMNRMETSLHGGRYVTREDILADLISIKDMNVNAIRTAHFPNNKLTYDLCDEMGIFLMDECNIESHIGEMELHVPSNNPAYNDLLIDRAINMVERDLNHPSVIMYSLGNETTYNEYPLDYNYGLYQVSLYMLEKDPSRLRLYERDNRVGNTRENSMVDVISSQYFPIEKMIQAAKDAKVPFLQQEFAHAMGNAVGNFREYMDAIENTPGCVGGFVWDFKDQSIRTRINGIDVLGDGDDWGQEMNDHNFCANGVLNADGSWSSDAYEIRAVYQNLDFEYQNNCIVIKNNNHVLDHFTFDIVYMDNGEIIDVDKKVMDITPQTSATYTLKEEKYSGEGSVKISCFRNSQSFILNEYEHNLKLQENNNSIKAEVNNDCLDIHYKDIDIQGLTFDLSRAPVDNDKDVDDRLFDVKLDISDIKETKDGLVIEGELKELNWPFALTFTYGKDEVLIDAKLTSNNEIEKILNIGLKMNVPSQFNEVSYYGYGPYESYPDKKDGTYCGLFDEKVDEYFNMMYVKPQDSGNHTDVRYFDLKSNKHTLTFEMNSNMNMKVTHYDDVDLKEAEHIEFVEKKDYTIVKCDYLTRGLGNASNGPKPLDKYTIKTGQLYNFKLKITFE